MSVQKFLLLSLGCWNANFLPLMAASVTLQSINLAWRNPMPEGLSGITYAGGERFYAVDDSGSTLYPMTIRIDLSTGTIETNTCHEGIVLIGDDLEGVAYDPANDSVYTSDEKGAVIREHALSGTLLGTVPGPENLKAFRNNFSLESLSLSGDALTLWTCNEEALANVAMRINDGALSSTNLGSVVRLTRFARSDGHAQWTVSGQWAYRTDPIRGSSYKGNERSGVVDLCALPNGTLLVLEREFSVNKFASFKSRIYRVAIEGAPEVSAIASLEGASYTLVAKTLLWDENTMLANFEGLCLGPKLRDGSLSVVLVSDGDHGAAKALYALKLSGLDADTPAYNTAKPD